jgi:hypothetical protein
VRGVDSREVNKEIRQQIWSDHKERGFTTRTARTAWRHRDDSVDVVNFQSFNAYNAGALGCTTFSFSVNLGVWLRYIPAYSYSGEVKRKDGKPLPQEYECHLRRSLRKGVAQPEVTREEIWFVREDGSNLSEVVSDAAGTLDAASDWFERFHDPEEVLRTLREDDEMMECAWGFGGIGSPVRHYLTGYTAIHIGRYELARASFEALLDSGAMTETYERVRSALRALHD